MYASPILIFVSPTFCVFATNYARKLDRKGSSGHLQRFCCLKSKSFIMPELCDTIERFCVLLRLGQLGKLKKSFI